MVAYLLEPIESEADTIYVYSYSLVAVLIRKSGLHMLIPDIASIK